MCRANLKHKNQRRKNKRIQLNSSIKQEERRIRSNHQRINPRVCFVSVVRFIFLSFPSHFGFFPISFIFDFPAVVWFVIFFFTVSLEFISRVLCAFGIVSQDRQKVTNYIKITRFIKFPFLYKRQLFRVRKKKTHICYCKFFLFSKFSNDNNL